MDSVMLQVRMLGELSIRAGENQIGDSENRSRKIWLLLAYLIYHRHRTVPQEELIELLWGEEPQGANPLSALKTTFHRLRSMLDRLWPEAGHQLILRRGNGYTWNEEIPICVDIDDFDRLSQNQSEDEDELLRQLMEALGLYQGDFLIRLSAETWVIPISAYFHNLYIQMVMRAVPLLSARDRCSEATDLCRAAVAVEPYHELLHRCLMRTLLDLGDQKGAAAVYEELSQRLFTNFGIMPEAETRSLYREAASTFNDKTMPLDLVCEQLKEDDPAAGALLCEYDFFKVLCYAEARSLARSGNAVHIALLSVVGERSKELPRRSLDTAMENLEEQIRLGLRRGDALAQCSVSQFILMLPQANYENSCKVCQRIIRAFSRQYPHSPAQIQYAVHPLEPNV